MPEERGHEADPRVVHCVLHEDVITFMSANSKEICGFSPEHYQGRPLSEFVHPEDHGALAPLAAPDWEGIIDAQFRMRGVDGVWTWRHAQGVRTVDADGGSSIVTLRKVDPPDAT